MHKNDKINEVLGLEREYWYGYHRHHINKVMIIVHLTEMLRMARMAKRYLVQCQTDRNFQRDVQETWRTSEGQIHYGG